MSKVNVLIVEDEAIVAADLASKLRQLDYQVLGIASQGEQAVRMAREGRPDVVLMDIHLPGAIDGVQAAEQIRTTADLPVIYLTAHSDMATLKRVKLTQPYGYILKPFEERELQTVIEMAIYKHQAERRLRESEVHFRTMAELVPDILYTANRDDERDYVNPRFPELTGLAPEASRGRQWMSALHPEDRDTCQQRWMQAVAAGEPFEMQYRLRVSDGTYRWFLDRARPIHDDSHVRDAVKWCGVCSDIHDLMTAQERLRESERQLEKKVQERTAKLQEANRELEAFTYSVSHDLRAPLRHIAGFIDLLRLKADQLDSQGHRFLDVIGESAERAGKMIYELLELSRRGRAALQLVDINVQQVVDQVRFELGEPAERVEWQIGELPSVVADPALFRIVLQNLLENAVKYSRNRESPRVAITAEVQDDFVRFSIRDNGVGFDMRFADKLFGVFQRLHRAEEFQGLGIGLANVQRIVHRHGGETWAEGVVDGGATFSFSLPRSRPPVS